MAETATNLEDTPTPPASGALVKGEALSHRAGRVLLGWLGEAEAIAYLLGRNATPEDDVAPLREMAASARAQVAARATYEPTNSVVAEQDANAVLAEVAKRPEVAAHFPLLAWRPVLVDLRQVLSFQQFVATEGQAQRVANADPEDLATLMSICIPSEHAEPPLGALTENDGKGITVMSANPNLRICGSQINPVMLTSNAALPPVPAQAVTFFLQIGTSYLQVVHYQERYFVRDGYHRASALLKRGIYVVPCIMIEARSLAEAVPGSAFLAHDLIFGPRPPKLTDFWDDSVSREVYRVSTRKVVRLTADEFVVPV